MRIGLIVGPWFTVPPEKYGGTERVVDALARALVDAGHEVLLATASDSTCPVPQVAAFGPSEPEEVGLTLSELAHVIKAYAGLQNVDIIHDHTLAGPLYSHRPVDVPVVTTIHGQLSPTGGNPVPGHGAGHGHHRHLPRSVQPGFCFAGCGRHPPWDRPLRSERRARGRGICVLCWAHVSGQGTHGSCGRCPRSRRPPADRGKDARAG